MTNEELYMVRHLAAQIGTDMVDIVPRMGESDGMLISADRNPNTNGARLVLDIEPGSKLDAIREGVRSGSIKGILSLGKTSSPRKQASRRKIWTSWTTCS